MKIHFIAIGGSVMHNLAVALQGAGHQITGSDDEIFEPSRSRLAEKGLLPQTLGWFPEKLDHSIDAVILGMHARTDNPELEKAKTLGLKIYSYPDFFYQHSIHKHRIVIAGSHGKTTTTAMILHVLKHRKKKFDYLVGASLNGFENPVHLSNDAPILVVEGDEYFASTLERVPKFLKFQPHIAVITGIAHDHINVFPTFDEYYQQFEQLVSQMPKAGILILNEEDKNVLKLSKSKHISEDVTKIMYKKHACSIKEGITYLSNHENRLVPVPFFGDHNLSNVSAALQVCLKIGISESEFYQAIQTFDGAAKRLQLVGQNRYTKIFRDFAHAPSKVEATVGAMKKQYPNQKLLACLELHTFSSLDKRFIGNYKDTMNKADIAIIYYNPHAVALKRLPELSQEEIRNSFKHKNLVIFTDINLLSEYLSKQQWLNTNLLMMSSGNFADLQMEKLSNQILG